MDINWSDVVELVFGVAGGLLLHGLVILVCQQIGGRTRP